MSIGDIKIPAAGTNVTAKQTTATKLTSASRENTDGTRRSLADIAQAKHTVYRRTGLLSIPKEIETFLISQKIHYRWVLNKATRLAEMKTGRGYEYLHESHLPPQLQTMLQGFKGPDGTYGSPAGDLVLMILGQGRANELRDIKNQEAQDQVVAAEQKIANNKAFYDKSTTKVEVGKVASSVRGRSIEAQDDTADSINPDEDQA